VLLASAGDLVDLVDEDHRVFHHSEPVEGLSNPRGDFGSAGPQLRGEDFNEGPSQSPGDTARERGFARSRWAEEDGGPRRTEPVSLRDRGVGERRNQGPFDELLRGGATTELRPGRGRNYSSAELEHHLGLVRSIGFATIEVPHRGGAGVALVDEGLVTNLALVEQGTQSGQTRFSQGLLEGHEERRTNSLMAPGLGDGESTDPRPITLHHTAGRSHNLPIGFGDQSWVTARDAADDFGDREHGLTPMDPGFIPHPDRDIKVSRLHLSNGPHRHSAMYPTELHERGRWASSAHESPSPAPKARGGRGGT
jgi:hypothetical protein